MLIKNAIAFQDNLQFSHSDIQINGTRIASLTPSSSSDDYNYTGDIIDATDCYVIPGLTDIHFHGCVGYDFCDGNTDAIAAMAAYELSSGICTICPATMTLPEKDLIGICHAAADFSSNQKEENHFHKYATLVGIHMEGPFLSYEKRGAQNPNYLCNPDLGLYDTLQQASNHLIRIVDVAPELPGSFSFIRQATTSSVVSIAHTCADYNTAAQAFEAGASHVTHLFNAMPGFTHRNPSVIGAAFDSKTCDVELICDGIHLSSTAIRAAFQLFGAEHIILISDSMMACGMENGSYQLGGQKVHVHGKEATLIDGTIAGSVTNLMDCLRHTVSIGIPLEAAIPAATINPARSINIEKDYGSITPGKIADLLILRKDLSIKTIIHNGFVVTL